MQAGRLPWERCASRHAAIIAAGRIEYSTDQQALACSLATVQSHDALSDNDQKGQTDVQPLRASEEPQPPLQLLPLPAQVQGEGLLLSDTNKPPSLASVCLLQLCCMTPARIWLGYPTLCLQV